MAPRFDLVEATDRYAASLRKFYIDVTAWKTFKTKHSLNWQKCRFTQQNMRQIPRERGIYVFTLELSPSKLPHHGYIMYVGITGDDSNAHLRGRYGQYLGYLRRSEGRPAVLYMLKKYKGHLFFNFVPLPDAKINIGAIEASFTTAINPPINKRDYNAELSAAKRAL